MGKKRKPVEIFSMSVVCPTTGNLISVDPKMVSFRGLSQECEICGSHCTVDMDIGICPSCGQTHPVTILTEY